MTEKLAGINSIIEALKGKRKVHKIYLQTGKEGKRWDELLTLAKKKGVYVKEVEKDRLNQMYKIGNHQGIVATVDVFSYASMGEIMERAASSGQEPLLLMLDGIEDPQNFGSIIRTAECAGVHGIIIPRHNSVEVNETVNRVASGAVEHMLIARETNLVHTLERLKEMGLWVVGSDINASSIYYSVALPRPTVLVVGGEGKGIRKLVKEHCDMLVRIPMFGEINSLNASVAASLLMYEVLRQRDFDQR